MMNNHHHQLAAEQATTSCLQLLRSWAEFIILFGSIIPSKSPMSCCMYFRYSVRGLPGFLPPCGGTYRAYSHISSSSVKRRTCPRNFSCRVLTLSISGVVPVRLYTEAFGILSTLLMFNIIRKQDVAKAFILPSMSLEMTQDSQPYSKTVTHVVSNNFTFVDIGIVWLLHRRSNFQNAVQARANLLFRSLLLDAIFDPRYVKSVTWLIGLPYTWRVGWEL